MFNRGRDNALAYLFSTRHRNLARLPESECDNTRVTRDDGGDAPADGVVEPHGSIVDVPLLRLHPVDVQALHEHPGKGGHEEVMEQDGDHCAQELEGEKDRERLEETETRAGNCRELRQRE